MYVPDIPEVESNYQGIYSYQMLSGTGTDSTEYKLYGDAPVSVDGYKRRVKIDDGFTPKCISKK